MQRYVSRHRAASKLSVLPTVLLVVLLVLFEGRRTDPAPDADTGQAGSSAGAPTTPGPAAGQPNAGQPIAGQPHAGQSIAGQSIAGQSPAGSGGLPTDAGAVLPTVSFPEAGAGTWTTVDASGPVAGTGGELLRYHVAVERGIEHLDPAGFAEEVGTTLADPRSWTGGGGVRLQPVGPAVRADFTVYLATPATRDELCADGYDRYTSCRNGDRVVINVARWVRGAPAFGADLQAYRRYVVNHEVGHRLGERHQRCPGAGRPAPVMQQQTLGRHGCRPNPWPLIGGRRHTGPAGEYDDPVPRSTGTR